MTELEEIFARDPLSLNSEGAVSYTHRELGMLVEYYRNLRIQHLAPKPAKEKRVKGAKVDLTGVLEGLDDL